MREDFLSIRPGLLERALWQKRLGSAIFFAGMALFALGWGAWSGEPHSLIPASLFGIGAWQTILLAVDSGLYAADGAVRDSAENVRRLWMRPMAILLGLAVLAIVVQVLIFGPREHAFFREMDSRSQFTGLWRYFEAGGLGMYPIALWSIITIGIIVERALVLYGSSINKEVFLATIQKCILDGDTEKAFALCSEEDAPLARILRAGLVKAAGSDDLIKTAMDEAAHREAVKISSRTGYLALLANLAMLSGLLGTIAGLIKSFGSVRGESLDPKEKARILAAGISEAMNCTAFGLIVAIVGLVGFAILNGKTQALENDINEATVGMLNVFGSIRAGIVSKPAAGVN